jgi:topoisomerase-4 subunit A
MESIDVKEIVQPDIKVYWDKTGGFFGTDVRGDDYFTVSPYEKFLVISKDATYKVVPIDDKIFIDVNVLYINVFDPKIQFSMIYTDLSTNVPYAKKFKIAKFIANKIYSLCPSKKGVVQYLSTVPKEKVKIYYKKKAKQKVNQEIFDFNLIEEKSPAVRGNKVSPKEIEKIEKNGK